MDANLTMGLEEELFLVDKETGELCQHWPDALWQLCQKKYPEQIEREFIRGQVELISKPADTIDELQRDMQGLRQFLIEQANKLGLAPIASGTHPSAIWQEQIPTISDRYAKLAHTLQVSAVRVLACGMHIHIGVADFDQRLKLYNSLIYYLPVFLALSASSPFWSGKDTGLASYRASVLKGLPRSGLPPLFHSEDEYQAYLQRMLQAKAIDSGKELWWDLRLSARFPTVELRVADVCTLQSDALALSALLQSLSCYLIETQAESQQDLEMKHMLTEENRWRGQRYAVSEMALISYVDQSLQPMSEIVAELVERLVPYAQKLGCVKHLRNCLTIVNRGTSAERQRQQYQQAISKGMSEEAALKQVVNDLISQTAQLEKFESLKAKSEVLEMATS